MYVSVELRTESCLNCGVVFAFPEALYNELQKRGPSKEFYCPNGHQMVYRESSEVVAIKKAQAEKNLALEEVERLKKELERMKQQSSIPDPEQCPYCRNHYKNLQKHIDKQHPNQ